eukprot:TRINITY_DN19254_c0_g1_i1.p1 TRINITY_DN19254_c0_g1~~TRINITY_DN19254_c0_g1_i1.p1  ORF type:complete len:103 (+),score=15.10 TRINITY_DN19254_c0_g1_i1:1-309(+)
MDPNMSQGSGGVDGNKGSLLEEWKDLDVYVGTDRSGKMHYCTLCPKFKCKNKSQVRCHVEEKHFKGYFKHYCKYCNDPFDCKTSLSNHVIRFCKYRDNVRRK